MTDDPVSSRSHTHRRSLVCALAASVLSALVLGPPIVFLGWIGLFTWQGGTFMHSTMEPSPTQALPYLSVSAVLIVDIVLWGWAGLRRLPRALTLTAAAPAVILAAIYLVGVASGAL